MALAEEVRSASSGAVDSAATAAAKELRHLQHWRQARTFAVNIVDGENVSKEWFQETGFTQPLVVLSRKSIGITGPPEPYAITSIGALVDHEFVLVIDPVARATVPAWTLAQWNDYVATPPSQRRSSLRLEAVSTALTPPTIVTNIGWIERFPSLPATPRHVKVCAKGSFEGFRNGSSGASTWITVLTGKLNIHLIPPTPENLRAYQTSRVENDHGPFDTLVEASAFTLLEVGATIFIPSGWLYATFAVEDVLLYEGTFLHDLDLATQWHCYHLDRVAVPSMVFPSLSPLLWHLACDYLRSASADEKAISFLLPALGDDIHADAAAHVLPTWDQPSAASVLAQLRARTNTPDTSATSSSSGDDDDGSSSSSSASDDSDSSLDSSVSEVEAAYPKFRRDRVSAPLPKLQHHLIVKIPTDAFPLKASMVPKAHSITTPGKKSKKAKAKVPTALSAEDWYFECNCGQKGQNYDDGKRMVQCESCPTWQHTHCANIPDDQEPPPGYTCFKCNATAVPGDWVVHCSCGIRAKNYDDGCRMVACDRCNTWQHTLCAGIPNDQEPPEDYVCLPCLQKKRPQKAVKSPKTAPVLPKSERPLDDDEAAEEITYEDEHDEDDHEDNDEDEDDDEPKKLKMKPTWGRM
ncbi:hypothetical protein SPRG_20791 [Saprolegnia parasitica CBS 223.65]|uniref:JmjC domain-containing protein n=1 Tax=Saprolegnia parasitica (strain CBS 223.65) TaxID=695850 RepID=A0A067C3Z9_SAPPC|nr:hypothetical protein SPRG_20791 [Saprolegnia parasitica CBS 223.65]KDO25213.1 hypothetical protein SPRG_20791 [Saprolegnia parasitica CBS 223.65]|eukprot:XP_012204118.1 hypothetical protein SPRG_20791 [Saprolegnia parasitica CBS 223.65]